MGNWVHPEEVGFATKGELARVMLQRALEAGVPARWIVADTVYGMTRGLRRWLEKGERSYVLALPQMVQRRTLVSDS